MAGKKINFEADRESIVDQMSDADLYKLAASITPWYSSTRINDSRVKSGPIDEDGFVVGLAGDYTNIKALQNECWNKFSRNPQISSHVRDFMGDLSGSGFGWGSEESKIDEVLVEISDDVRNELPLKFPKYVARSEIEGELFLSLSLHMDGFVEVDFMEPSSLSGGQDNSGIYFHPRKKTMPMFYEFNLEGGTKPTSNKIPVKKNAGGKVAKSSRSPTGTTLKTGNMATSVLIPSIYVAYFPELAKETIEYHKLDEGKMNVCRVQSGGKYKKTGGFYRFIVSWDRSFLTARNVSHIKTTIEWVNHYENLKKWEIDHKKSAGSYLWVVKMEDAKAFRTWVKMTDEERASTGLTAQKTPGGTIICPPGISIECQNPNLPTISEQDTDIFHMITSGLNRPEDTVSGQTKGDTFSGVKASRGPMSDRIADEIEYFEKFLRLVFWRGIFYLRSTVTSFKLDYKVEEVTEFKNKEAVTRKVTKKAHELIDFDFPTPEIADLSSKANAFLGSKHLSIVESLGIPMAEVAKRLGFRNYAKKRKQYATEKEIYPNLPAQDQLESLQEAGGESAMVTPDPGKTPNTNSDENQSKGPNKTKTNPKPSTANPTLKKRKK